VHLRSGIAALAVVAIAACGGDAETTPRATQGSPTQTAPTPSPEPSASPTTPTPSPPATTTPATPATPTAPTTPTPAVPPSSESTGTSAAEPASPTPDMPAELPGEPIEFGPRAGDVLAVVGVAHDDRLNLRAGPGTDQEILARLSPTEDAMVAQGATRTLDDRSYWYEVEVDGTTGWVSARYVAYLGPVTDATSRVVADLGFHPTATTMAELGRIVADSQRARTDTGYSELSMVVAPDETGDLGEVTWEVLGLADDSIGGLRLHVFGTPGADGFSLASVEQTHLCLRGGSADEPCA
jgi:hypothetical protein